MANTTRISKIRTVNGNATTAEVNAGKVIVSADSDRSIIVVGGWIRALGGAASGATSIDISDTASSPVAAAAVAYTAATQGTIVPLTSAGTATNLGVALTLGKGLQICKSGSSLATATSVDYSVQYMVV